jgi:putative oxidoreductase
MSTLESTGKGKTYALWALRGVLALAFLAAGGTKLAGMSPQPEHFTGWGYPLWFMYVTGLLEITGAIGLLVPRLVGPAALLLSGVMVGAVGTLLAHGEVSQLLPPVIFLGLLLVIAYARRDTVLHLLSRPRRGGSTP